MADHLVALTGGRLEPGAVRNSDSPADRPDEPCPLEQAGGCVDGGPPYPEHLAHELLRERELVAADSIVRHEQPAGEPRLDGMGSIAPGRLGQQGQECVGVAHPLATGRGNFDGAAFVENGHDGEDRIDGEVHVCQRLVWLIGRLLEGRPERV